MTGREALRFGGRFRCLSAARAGRRAGALLELCGLDGEADEPVGDYSAGMWRRLGIAEALIGSPELLLLDEPCTGLDVVERRRILDILNRLRGDLTLLLSAQSLLDVADAADEVAVLASGRLAFHEPLRGCSTPVA
jgi:ABC-2 type transport system ATP-binding protein